MALKRVAIVRENVSNLDKCRKTRFRTTLFCMRNAKRKPPSKSQATRRMRVFTGRRVKLKTEFFYFGLLFWYPTNILGHVRDATAEDVKPFGPVFFNLFLMREKWLFI